MCHVKQSQGGGYMHGGVRVIASRNPRGNVTAESIPHDKENPPDPAALKEGGGKWVKS